MKRESLEANLKETYRNLSEEKRQELFSLMIETIPMSELLMVKYVMMEKLVGVERS